MLTEVNPPLWTTITMNHEHQGLVTKASVQRNSSMAAD